MKRKISYYLGQNGYLRMMTNLPEFTIFFKRENGFVSMIELVDMGENPYITEDALHSITQKARWKFMDQGCEEIHYLVLVLANSVERAVSLGNDEPFYWIVDVHNKELIVPEGKAEDFYGMRSLIREWVQADFDESKIAGDELQYDASGRRTRKNLREQPLVNHFLFLINALVFTFCTLSGDLLYNYGALSLRGVEAGQWYRLITCMFLHGDMMHLVGNMMILVFLGDIVERQLGHVKYFLLYFLAGLCGGAASLFMQSLQPEISSSIGASGAIFGMVGGLLWLLIRNRGYLETMSVPKVLFLICYTIYRGLVSTNIDNAAHIGGLVAGFVLCIFLYHKKRAKAEER